MDIATFSALTLQWQRLALEGAPESFRAKALAALERHFHFSAAWWGMVGWWQQWGVFSSYVHHLPEHFVTQRGQISDDAPLTWDVVDVQGAPVWVCHTRLSWEGGDPIAAFRARYQLASFLSIAQPLPQSGLGRFISFFRNENLPPFTTEERQLAEHLAQHLWQAEQLSWQRVSDAQSPGGALLRAHASPEGYLLHATPEFCAALMAEFPQWGGDVLPEPIRCMVAAGAGHWQGRLTRLHVERGRSLAATRCHLVLQRRLGHGLTPREEAVARAYAAGRSYKEIARDCGLSPTTVRGYLRECYAKLGVRSKAELGARLV